ncbi:hypothetical protein NCCP1664_09340 [Zafaria cholistanensis]|uniref:Uncharacterized protein n=1 Tax=Zafaria cholistanensis TaxID=1682741 RepID=A0A5A7NR31_9MICC|nr:hypothetical protein [Zafaria cholistanensis]GER22437.1 hypothetical protein NCCP1664_09340 [Zafaria cholistanensis]
MSHQTSKGSGEAHAVAGPFTLREAVLLGGALLLLVGSVLPFQVSSTVFANLWVFPGTLFHLGVTLILPLAVAGGFVWRRLVGRPVVRVGSLALDQLGSISAVLSVAYFFFAVVGSLNGAYLLGLFGALAFLAATTLTPFIPAFSADFEPAPGHLLTRPVRPVALRTAAAPAFPKPGPAVSASAPSAAGTAASAPAAAASPGTGSGSSQPAGATGWADSPAPAMASAPAPALASAPAPAAERSAPAGQEQSAHLLPETGALPESGAVQDTGAVPSVAAQSSGDSGQPGRASAWADSRASAPATVQTVERSDRTAQAGQEQPQDELSREAAPSAGAASSPATLSVPAVTPAAAESGDEPFAASLHEEVPTSYQAFWFAVPQTRYALDETTGAVAFTLHPGAWILALEDRGDEFLVQDTDGRLGVLRDLAHVERA